MKRIFAMPSLFLLAAVLPIALAAASGPRQVAPAEAPLSPQLATSLTLLQTATTTGPDKVEVCHATGSGEGRIIRASGRALAAHLAHGDSLSFQRLGRNRCGF